MPNFAYFVWAIRLASLRAAEVGRVGHRSPRVHASFSPSCHCHTPRVTYHWLTTLIVLVVCTSGCPLLLSRGVKVSRLGTKAMLSNVKRLPILQSVLLYDGTQTRPSQLSPLSATVSRIQKLDCSSCYTLKIILFHLSRSHRKTLHYDRFRLLAPFRPFTCFFLPCDRRDFL